MNNTEYHAEEPDIVLKKLSSSYKGIKSSEVKERRLKYGANILQEKKRRSFIVLLLSQFAEPMTIVLLLAAAFGFISSGLGWDEKGHSSVSIEGIVIIVILAINIVITIIQEYKTTSALESLKKMTAPVCRVIRDGEQDSIPSSELVVGDLVYLDDGCIVPADVRLYDSAALHINESSLTGESVAVEKNSDITLKANTLLADRKNMAYSSTIVTSGKSYGIVVNVGHHTEVGKVANLLEETEDEEIPIKRKLNFVCKCLTIIGAVCALLIVVLSVINNAIDGLAIFNDWTGMIFLAISLAVSVIPEGLPATSTIVLAVGVQKMAKEHALVKQLASVETLGSVSVICSDKTGTLTQNKMIIKKIYSGLNEVEEKKYSSYEELLMAGVYCNNAYMEDDGGILGDPTEGSFLLFAEKYIENKWKSLRTKNPKIEELPFDSERKCMSTIHNINNKKISYTKGSVESLLKNCKYICDGKKTRAITTSDKNKIIALAEKLANDSLRTLGLCKNSVTGDYKKCETNMTWLGMVAMFDPPREEVKETIRICHEAKIRVVMITGDHPSTALSIATYLGIVKKDVNDQVITGYELAEMPFETLKEKVRTCNIFARVSPNDKINIVKALKENGEMVSMTGDGVNDSPSLKLADVGVAMGITGTDVAKDAADVILLDDDFNTIEVAIKEGRRIFANIQKVISFLVSGNIAEIILILIATIFKKYFDPLPITAILILFINLLTDTIPGVSLGLDVASPDIMSHKPIGNADFFNRKIVFGILYYGIFLALITIGGYILAKEVLAIDDNKHIIAFSFATISFTEMAIIFCFKSQSMSIFNPKLKYNPWILYSCLISIAITIAIVYVPGLNSTFSLAPLPWYEWIYALGLAAIPIITCETSKLVKRLRK